MAMGMPRGPDWLRRGGKAELRSDEAGYSGAWFAVEIMKLFPSNQAAVEYLDFVMSEEPGAKRITEFVKVDNLRPLPPVLPRRKSWKLRDSVETLHRDAWWVGYIKDVGAKPNTYRVYYGKDQEDLDIPAADIRPRQNYVRPTREYPNGSWSMARPMQNPAVWERILETLGTKTPGAKTPLAKKPVASRPVGQILPRVSTAAPPVEGKSDDSWDEREERRQKGKRARRKMESQSQSAPAKSETAKKKVIRFVTNQGEKRVTITQAIPAINPPAKLAEQSTLVLTPGSSPPVADSPLQDSGVSPEPNPQPQNLMANSEASPPTRSTSSNSSSGSGSSNSSSSSGEDDNDCAQSGDDDQSAEEELSMHGRTSNGLPEQIFQGFSTDVRVSQNMQVYRQLLECFRNSDKGSIDETRREILRGVRAELKLSTEQCDRAHCQVFGMPCAFW